MKKYFVVYYDKAVVDLYYDDEKFSFDLSKGDVGDYWDCFTTKEGMLRDINFYQDTPECLPTLSTYGVVNNYTDSSDEEPIRCLAMRGNVENYFNL